MKSPLSLVPPLQGNVQVYFKITHLTANSSADITICVPAFNTGRRLGDTLRSLWAQDHRDFRVIVAIEPTVEAGETLRIAREFADVDSRFEIHLNPRILGWAENHRQLQKLVTTEYYQFLPHDDALHPSCVGLLYRAIHDHPEAAIVFPHIYFVHGADGLQTPVTRRGDCGTRLRDHFAGGGHPEFWKGLSRTALIPVSGGFPAYGEQSFAAEYEWAARLLAQGEAIAVPEAIYYKRIHRESEYSVSNDWIFKESDERRLRYLAEHDERMRCLIESLDFGVSGPKAIREAWTAAYLWRILEFGLDRRPLSPIHRALVGEMQPEHGGTRHRLRLSELRSRMIEKDWEEAESELAQLNRDDPENHDAGVLWMKCLLHLNRVDEAVRQMNWLERRFPNSWRHRELQSWLAANLANQYGKPTG